MKLQDKVAIITGGTKGIGFAIASAFAGEGAQVVVCSRSRRQSAAAATEITRQGGRALGLSCDVRKERHLASLVKRTIRKFGRIDILVANAAVLQPIAPVKDMSVAAWRTLIEINLTGAMMSCRSVLPQMIRQNYGRIQILGSGLELAVLTQTAAYSASKAGVSALARVVAAEVISHDIKVNVHYPGDLRTEMNPGGPGVPEDAVPCAVWLASLPGNGPTGRIFTLDKEVIIESREVPRDGNPVA